MQTASTLDGYNVQQTLGSGFSAKVKLATDEDNQEFALKIFDLTNPRNNKKAIDLLKKEVEATQKLEYKHIVKYYEFKEASTWNKNGQQVPVAYIAQEAIRGGELFDYVANSGAFSENICRYYFKQMLLGLHYIHKNGFSHRDLKPENILLDHNYDLKIVDFGFACPLEGRDGTGFNRSVIGTPGYMAPEILEKQPYQGQVADLFAAGVILFIMLTQHPPFQMAKAEDMYYKLLATNRADLFWKAHSTRKAAGFFSESFKDLITSMLQLHPHQRLCMADIIGHPWLAGETATEAEVQAEFARRQEICKARANKEKAKKAAQMLMKKEKATRRSVQVGETVYMSGEPTAEEAVQEKEGQINIIKIQMKECDAEKNNSTSFFTDLNSENILTELINYLQDSKTEFKVSGNASKITYTKIREKSEDDEESKEESKQEEGDVAIKEQAQIAIQLFDAGDGMTCVDFKRKQGSSMVLFHEFNQLRDQIIKEIDDETTT